MIGSVCYFVLFSVQVVILFATWVSAIVIYVKLALFLKPEKQRTDDQFEPVRGTMFEQTRSLLRRQFQAKYLDMNLHFIVMIAILTIRTGTYAFLRLTSKEKLLEWTLIRPVVFYLTYATDLAIVGGVMYFVWKSTPLEADVVKLEKEQENQLNENNLNGSFEKKSDNSRSEIDGDELIRRQRANSSDS